MDKYTVRLNLKAYKDIDEIFSYIALEKLSPENAKAQTERIWKALKSLEIFPEAHQDRVEGYYAGKGYKQLLIDNYLAIFKINKDKKIVQIITVQYQARNL